MSFWVRDCVGLEGFVSDAPWFHSKVCCCPGGQVTLVLECYFTNK